MNDEDGDGDDIGGCRNNAGGNNHDGAIVMVVMMTAMVGD